MNTISENVLQINNLCKAHHVRSLFAFGSVVNNQLNMESDIDFIVDIDRIDPLDYSDNYFELKTQLEKLFNRKVDFLEDKAIKNVFLKNKIESTKVLVY